MVRKKIYKIQLVTNWGLSEALMIPRTIYNGNRTIFSRWDNVCSVNEVYVDTCHVRLLVYPNLTNGIKNPA